MKLFLTQYFLINIFYSFGQNLFTQVPSSESNINFENLILETKNFNILNYEYIYNGGGVAIGDINNDGLSDIFFTGNMVHNALYLNKGNLKFRNIGGVLNSSNDAGFNTGATMVDINNDGWLDIYICKSALQNPAHRVHQLFINNRNLTFTESAAEYGLADSSFSTQAYFFDMDNDNDIDLFLVNHPYKMGEAKKVNLTYNDKNELGFFIPEERQYVSNRYYENQNGKFVDRTISAGLGTYAFGLSAVISDFNLDGYPDIYTANDYTMPDALFINNKDGTFSDKFDNFFTHCSYNSMGTDYADLDNDGFDDLFGVDMLPENNLRQKQFRQLMSYDQYDKLIRYGLKSQLVKNVLQWNQKGKGFSDIAAFAGVANSDWSWAPLIVDFDNNGFKDIYVTNGYFRDFTDQDIVKYKLDSMRKNIAKSATGDNINSLMSIFSTVRIPNYFYANYGHMKFTTNPPGTGLDVPSLSNGAAYADLDNDGDLEIIVNNINEPAFLFKNNSSENKLGNFIRFKLQSIKGDAKLYGTRIEVRTPDSNLQFITYYPTKGFMSCHEKMIHFGIGTNMKARVILHLKDGQKHELKNLEINKLHLINIDNLVSNMKESNPLEPILFANITDKINLKIEIKENEYIDYKQEPLLPHKFSNQGPCIAVGDINGDKLDDFFIGGAKDQLAQIYIQNSSGFFTKMSRNSFELDRRFEDANAAFLDFDKDGDQDLIVLSGGNEYVNDVSQYPVRLYINDGIGNFSKASKEIFPIVFSSSKALAIKDYNRDGYVDVFIGGRIVPGHYGKIPESYLLNNINGTYVLDSVMNFLNSGLITDATWIDADENGWEDLLIVGEWMPPSVFLNQNGTLNKSSVALVDNFGWWTSVHISDLNRDGKKDIIFGNYGLNSRYVGTKAEPLNMVVNDFDRNGTVEAILSFMEKGKRYPFPIRDNLLDQIPILKKRFNRYDKYSSATINDIFDEEQSKGARVYKADYFYSCMAINQGKGSFDIKKLPKEAQIFPVNAINTCDIDNDGDMDILLSGNDYGIEIESGRLDAGRGLVLENKVNTFYPKYNTGYTTLGDVKTVKPIIIAGKQAWLVGKNNSFLEILYLMK